MARNARVCGWPSRRVTIDVARSAGTANRGSRSVRVAWPRRARPAWKSRPGLVTHTTSAPNLHRVQPVSSAASASGIRRYGADGDRPLCVSAQGVATGDDVAPPAFAGRGVVRDRGERLVDRAGGQPQVGRHATRFAELGEAGQQRSFGVKGERRFLADASRLLEADRRRVDRLVRAPLRARASRRRACRPGSTGRRRRCRTTRAPGRVRRTGRTSRRSAAAAGPSGSRSRPAEDHRSGSCLVMP